MISLGNIFPAFLPISVRMRGWLLERMDSQGYSRTVSFVFEQSGAPFPAQGLIVLVTRCPELSAILNCAGRDLREFKKATTATATGTSPNKRYNEQNNSCARAFQLFVHFFTVLCKTAT